MEGNEAVAEYNAIGIIADIEGLNRSPLLIGTRFEEDGTLTEWNCDRQGRIISIQAHSWQIGKPVV